MPKYTISYYFEGQGEVEIEANSPEQAEEKWFNGDYDQEKEEEWGENYIVDEVQPSDDIGFKVN